ncbi:MAG: hypothetical protein A2139_06155 [Desulfobacca sp. RBG_16_60_12]|nr:MAG: hypothetical protein A2139_06155 [Desulfobacca sp. RBG_16_60_12]
MKKQAIIISSIAIFLTMIVNVGDLRCQENSNMINEQYQSKYMEKIAKTVSEDNVKNDKNIGVEILGWIIQHNLFCEYQKIDSKELEDRLEKSR